jgi:hypothetical protein
MPPHARPCLPSHKHTNLACTRHVAFGVVFVECKCARVRAFPPLPREATLPTNFQTPRMCVQQHLAYRPLCCGPPTKSMNSRSASARAAVNANCDTDVALLHTVGEGRCPRALVHDTPCNCRSSRGTRQPDTQSCTSNPLPIKSVRCLCLSHRSDAGPSRLSGCTQQQQ